MVMQDSIDEHNSHSARLRSSINIEMPEEHVSAMERLKKRISDIEQVIATDNKQASARITLRLVIREAQMKLAVQLGLAPELNESAARAWEGCLPQGSIEQRLTPARALIQAKPDPSPELARLLVSPHALRLLVDLDSI